MALSVRGYEAASAAGPSVGTSVSFIVIDALASCLYTSSRLVMKVSGSIWTDLFILASWIFNLGLCICTLLEYRYGAGSTMSRVQTFSTSDVQSYEVVGDMYFIFYLFAITAPKLAVLIFYLHIFVDRISRCAIFITMAITAGAFVGNLVCFILPITPAFQNQPELTYFRFIDAHETWSSFPNIITDLIVLIVPIPIVLKLHARSWSYRFGILILFLVGSAGLITSIIRFIEFYEISLDQPLTGIVRRLVWSVVEGGIYHLAACLLMCGPIISYVFHDGPFRRRLYRFIQPMHRLVSGSDVC